LLTILLLAGIPCFAQCLLEKGPAPASATFTSGVIGDDGVDSRWKVAGDSINAEYLPAVSMIELSANYYNASSWISFSQQGEHSGNRFFFFKTDLELPCFNECDKSFGEAFAFCLNLNLYSDNSIFEIYVNGVPQSTSQFSWSSFNDPFNPGSAHNQSTNTPVMLCHNWKPGKNTLIIQIASSATIAGIYIEGNNEDPPQQVLRKEICKGSQYLGRTTSGKFLEHFIGVNGCDSTREIDLVVRDPEVPGFGRVPGICQGDSITITPGEFESYNWNDGSRGSSLTVTKPGLYSVSVKDACSTGTAQVAITAGDCGAFFPNAFTANGDGINDRFGLRSDLVLEHYSLQIFNRWGMRVFATNDPLKSWDGTSNGKPQPSGAYVWHCVFTRARISSQIRGTVLLIK
jgi:gliding motility-associated-like protein